jgi:hypothetical protein
MDLWKIESHDPSKLTGADTMKLFAQLAKVDEEKRLVYGRAAEEVVDKSDEIMDYMSSKPHFQKWSADIAKDTNGKNLGNVRAMHGKVAAGALTDIAFDDDKKAIDVCAKIVDDGEWKKVLAGVYTGFSIGGSYVGDKKVEKIEDKDITRYTAMPTEISLVDRPCIPTAKFFEVQKLDGTVAKVEFQPPEEEEEADVTVNGTADDVAKLGKLMNDKGLSIADVIERLSKAWPPADDKPAADAAEPDADDAKGAKGKKGKPAADAADDDADDQAKCAEKVEKVEQPVAKVDTGELQKIMDATVAPLQKALADAVELIKAQAESIKKLEEQPAVPRISLRAVSKSEDVVSDADAKVAKVEAIVDDLGDKHEAAGFIKMLHRSGGAPLNASMRK